MRGREDSAAAAAAAEPAGAAAAAEPSRPSLAATAAPPAPASSASMPLAAEADAAGIGAAMARAQSALAVRAVLFARKALLERQHSLRCRALLPACRPLSPLPSARAANVVRI